MPLDENLRRRIEGVLHTLDDQGTLGPRLADDAARLLKRLRRFIAMDLVGPDLDMDALELATYALQLPIRQGKGLIAGRLGRTNLRERCEQAAELLVSLLGSETEEGLLDRATRLLHEVSQRSPMLDEAKLLADALNLEDFGLTGFVQQTIQLALQGEGVAELALASEKREQYGYWEARLKDGFHFEPVRGIARRRLENFRQAAKLLQSEMNEDQP